MKPVLIIGGGPVGLTLALLLAEAEIPCIVFETEPAVPDDLRASTFHPPTLDMLDRFSLGQALVACGLITPKWQIRLQETGERAEFDLSVLKDDTKHPYRLQCEQQKLQHLILDRLQAVSHTDIRFGVEVTAAGQDDSGIWVQTAAGKIDGSWLIGADGSRSIVRKAFDIGFEGETYPETTLLVTTDFDFAGALDGLAGVNYIWSPSGTFSLLRLPGVWRCSFYPRTGETPEEALSPDAVEAQLQQAWPRRERYNVLHKRSYRIHQRVAEAYRRGRALLAGDAAHLNSPSGGMGMNGGIHDAFNLAEKLIAVWHGADDTLLDRYERQRRPIAIDHVLAQADRNRRRMRETNADRRRDMLTDLQRICDSPDLARDYLLKSSMISGLRDAERIA